MMHVWVVLVKKVAGYSTSMNVSQEAYTDLEKAIKFVESRRSTDEDCDSYWIDPFTFYVEGKVSNEFTKYVLKEVTIV